MAYVVVILDETHSVVGVVGSFVTENLANEYAANGDYNMQYYAKVKALCPAENNSKKELTPIFLGEGNGMQQVDVEYLNSRKNYWEQASEHSTDKLLKNQYASCALGYEMLLDGRVKYSENGSHVSYINKEQVVN